MTPEEIAAFKEYAEGQQWWDRRELDVLTIIRDTPVQNLTSLELLVLKMRGEMHSTWSPRSEETKLILGQLVLEGAKLIALDDLFQR